MEKVIQNIQKKLSSHREFDTSRKLNPENLITPAEALKLLVDTLEEHHGKCPECDVKLKTIEWTYPIGVVGARPLPDNDQFSFDRLDDLKGHSRDNLRVVCLGCNLKAAKMLYQPCMDYFDIYNTLKAEFFHLQKIVQYIYPEHRAMAKNALMGLSNSCRKYHTLTYGDRRANNWKSCGYYKRDVNPDYIAYWDKFLTVFY